jgi:outer membrane immunogenic protein
MKKLVGSVALAAMIAGPAMAADMAVYKAPPVVVYNWTGFYAGANLGYSWGTSRSDWNVLAASPLGAPGFCGIVNNVIGNLLCANGTDSHTLNGAIAGLQAGYNWQTGNFLLGIETDIQISGQRGDGTSAVGIFAVGQPTIVSTTHTEKLLWLGTLRGRAGFASDRWLIYATGGLAYGEVASDGSATATTFFCGGTVCPLSNWSNRVTKAGWTVGAGVEGAVSRNWSLKVEYLYVDLGTVSTAFATLPGCYGAQGVCSPFGAGNGNINSKITDNILRVGLNYKFGGPVVAKY